MYLRIAIRFPVGYLDVWDSNFRVHTQQQTYRERWGERKILHEEVIDEILRSTRRTCACRCGSVGDVAPEPSCRPRSTRSRRGRTGGR